MSLALTVQRNDKTSFLVNDTTTYSAELVRSDFHLYLVSELYLKTAYSPIANTSTLVPSLATQWKVDTPHDGSFRLTLVAAKPWEALLTYPVKSIVSDEGKLFVAIKAVTEGVPTENIDYWKEVQKSSDLDLLNGNPNGHLAVTHFLHDNRSVLCIGEKSIAYASEQCGCTDECETIKDWAWSMIFHSAATWSMLFGEYQEAGKFIDNVNARCGTDSGKAPCNCN